MATVPRDLVDRLFNAAFDTVRDPRSAEYKEGVRAALNYRINRAPARCRYTMGTVQADAFFSGVAEGNAIWRAHAEACHGEAGSTVAKRVH